MSFHSVAVKDTSCTIRVLVKFEFSARASNKSRLMYFHIWTQIATQDLKCLVQLGLNKVQ